MVLTGFGLSYKYKVGTNSGNEIPYSSAWHKNGCKLLKFKNYEVVLQNTIHKLLMSCCVLWQRGLVNA